jgi:glycosyltransferase involved in cell wall biosynthesis
MDTVSVVLPIYGGDDPSEMARAIESIGDQTQPPDELIFVRDVPISDANTAIIDECTKSYVIIKIESLEEKRGPSVARHVNVLRTDQTVSPRECPNRDIRTA